MARISPPLRITLVVLLIAALLLALVWLLQRRLIYFPDRSAPAPVAGVEEVTLDTADGLRLTAWLIRPDLRADRRVTVLVAPGNAGNRLGRMPLARALAARGLTVLLVDYRGYGGNPGSPSETGLAHDVDAARTFAAGLDFPVVYYGESLGAAVVTALAVRHPPAALALRSPFTDLPAAGQEQYPFLPVRALLRDRYPVAGPITGVTAPTLVVYGTADSVVPAVQSRAVAASAAGPVTVVVVEGADHNDAVLLDGRLLIDAVLALTDSVS